MNKTAVSMKKLLIATCLLAMSTTAIANSTDRQRQSGVSKNLTIAATYVETLALSLDITEIDFGEVYTGAITDSVKVTAKIVGDGAEGFDFEIIAETENGNNGLITVDFVANNHDSISYTGQSNLVAGKFDLEFYVNLNSSVIISDLSESSVYIKVSYNSIAGTTTTPAS